MKKLVLLVAVFATVSLFSCTGNQETSNASNNDSVPAAVEQNDSDTVKVETPEVAAPQEGEAAPEVKEEANKDANAEVKDENKDEKAPEAAPEVDPAAEAGK